MKEMTLSIDLQSRQIAIFDGFVLVRDFQPFTNKYKAIEEAMLWIAAVSKTENTPIKVVYTEITRIRMSS